MWLVFIIHLDQTICLIEQIIQVFLQDGNDCNFLFAYFVIVFAIAKHPLQRTDCQGDKVSVIMSDSNFFSSSYSQKN